MTDEGKRDLSPEDEEKAMHWALDTIKPIIESLPNNFCKGTVALNVAKTFLMDEARSVTGDTEYFQPMLEVLCDRFANAVKTFPEIFERELKEMRRSKRHKDCNCIGCALRKAVDEALSGKKEEPKEHSVQ